jgi:hypothetical protein
MRTVLCARSKVEVSGPRRAATRCARTVLEPLGQHVAEPRLRQLCHLRGRAVHVSTGGRAGRSAAGAQPARPQGAPFVRGRFRPPPRGPPAGRVGGVVQASAQGGRVRCARTSSSRGSALPPFFFGFSAQSSAITDTRCASAGGRTLRVRRRSRLIVFVGVNAQQHQDLRASWRVSATAACGARARHLVCVVREDNVAAGVELHDDVKRAGAGAEAEVDNTVRACPAQPRDGGQPARNLHTGSTLRGSRARANAHRAAGCRRGGACGCACAA